jgi:hypothetical protein
MFVLDSYVETACTEIVLPMNPRGPTSLTESLCTSTIAWVYEVVSVNTPGCPVLGARDNGTEISMAMLVCLISHSSPFNDKSRFKPDRLNVHIAYELRILK